MMPEITLLGTWLAGSLMMDDEEHVPAREADGHSG